MSDRRWTPADRDGDAASARAWEHRDDRHILSVGPRHRTPASDDLLAMISHATTGSHVSVLLEREDAEALHQWLAGWLRDGWPGVARGAGRLIVTGPDGKRRRIRPDGTELEVPDAE